MPANSSATCACRIEDRNTKSYSHAGDLPRQPDHPRQHARRLHDGDAGVAAERVLALELDGEIQALVEHARKGVRRVEPDRRQHRHHLAQEIGLDPLRLRGSEIGAAQEADAFRREPGQDLLVEQAGTARRPARAPPSPPARTPGRARMRSAPMTGDPASISRLQPGDADFEELVEIGGDDAQEAQPLQQRRRAVLRLRQHAPVERELAELAVEIQLRDVAWLVHQQCVELWCHVTCRA